MNGGAAAYRDPKEGLAARRKELIEERRRELAVLPAAAKRAYAWRVARTVASITALIGASFVVLMALGSLSPRPAVTDCGRPPGMLDALRITWAVTMVLGTLSWIAVRLTVTGGIVRVFRPTGDLAGDVARLETTTPLTALRELGMRSERHSVGLWLAAAVFHMPLAGVCLVSWIFTHGRPADEMLAYGVVASLGGVGALMVMALRFARDLGSRQVLAMLHADWNDGSTALGIGIAGAAVWAVAGSLMVSVWGGAAKPFVGAAVVWIMLSTLWVPGLFRHARRAVAAERQALGIEANVNWPRAV